MDTFKKYLRRLVLLLLILLAIAGVGLPIPYFAIDKFRIKTEIIDNAKEEEDLYEL